MKYALLLLAGLVIAGCSKPAPQADDKRAVSIWVAASANGVIDDLDDRFEQENGVDIEVVPGPSNALARQIVEGANADLFLPADEEMADYVASKGLVANRIDLLTNRLVVVVGWDSPLKIASLADLKDEQIKRVAIAEQKVPAGEYARQSLEKAGVLDAVLKKAVGGVDVTATLNYVATKEADAGIVYWTDTLGNTNVQVAYEIPDDMHEPIVYPLVLLKQAKDRDVVQRFSDYLRSPTALEVYRKAGFDMPEKSRLQPYVPE